MDGVGVDGDVDGVWRVGFGGSDMDGDVEVESELWDSAALAQGLYLA